MALRFAGAPFFVYNDSMSSYPNRTRVTRSIAIELTQEWRRNDEAECEDAAWGLVVYSGTWADLAAELESLLDASTGDLDLAWGPLAQQVEEDALGVLEEVE